MSPFGSKPAETQSSGGEAGERWELRHLTIEEGQPQTSKNGKLYWRVRDSSNYWYSVWTPALKATLETAADSGTPIDCAVQIKPGNAGGKPFYTIQGAGASAAAIVEEGKVKAHATAAPGGRGSEFGRRMHPDDALRVTMLATLERAIQMVAMTLADKPEKTSYETWVKSKTVEYNNFLMGLVKMPLTPTPETAPSPETPPPLTDADVPTDDEDIPF